MSSFTCPICSTNYENYRDYFNCWTKHLEEKYGVETNESEDSVDIPTDHDAAVKWLKRNPSYIEDGMHVIESEVAVFHGRIDLIGFDKQRRLVIIDVDNGHDINRKVLQLRKYKKNLVWMATRIFGIDAISLPKFRLIIINPHHFIKDVTNSE